MYIYIICMYLYYIYSYAGSNALWELVSFGFIALSLSRTKVQT